MTSFLTHRTRVHDDSLPLHRRHSALRTCLTIFAPYGLRATYHHLTLSAAIPRRLEADPDALVRAVEELHEARVLWLARAEEYAAQRRAEKRAGRRAVPDPRPWWLRSWWESPSRAWFEDPFRHPSLRLPEYVRRQNAILDGAQPPGCPACGEDGLPALSSTGHGWVELCRECAWVLAPCPCGRRHRFVPGTPFNWKGIWQRAHMSDDGTPNPHWPAGQPVESPTSPTVAAAEGVGFQEGHVRVDWGELEPFLRGQAVPPRRAAQDHVEAPSRSVRAMSRIWAPPSGQQPELMAICPPPDAALPEGSLRGSAE